jgi:hypothetical protein
VFRYKMHFEDGSEAGDAAYADFVNPGEEVLIGAGKRLRVLELVLIGEEEDSPYTGLLKSSRLRTQTGTRRSE